MTYENIETVSLNYLVDGSKGEITTIMNSSGYYDYSWREPVDIDWAVIEDIGWNKKSEGTLSEKINTSKNINGADDFTFNIGGNVTDGSLGVDLSFSEFAFYFGVTDVLNISSGSEIGNVSDLYII